MSVQKVKGFFSVHGFLFQLQNNQEKKSKLSSEDLNQPLSNVYYLTSVGGIGEKKSPRGELPAVFRGEFSALVGNETPKEKVVNTASLVFITNPLIINVIFC